ncbi:hypothetical protein C5C07_19725 [Haloferax sp. Atlit-4N]|uniref:hypothetical protein n=1 Tax=Haloferax sp. Atlit-4N TaxID=2077206 RepID=UPI000E2540E6|nr:hypothetical protein [Haloferax sp. Atlit-4N]RDZ49995.1 hypothetical protein C5C07_19725 [Haloferax sp. Atlit-4N]
MRTVNELSWLGAALLAFAVALLTASIVIGLQSLLGVAAISAVAVSVAVPPVVTIAAGIGVSSLIPAVYGTILILTHQ